MENNANICPNVEKCPIFNAGILMSEKTGDSYKTIYCLSENHVLCKRYLAHQICGKSIPVQVLPNTVLTPEEIVKRMENGFYAIFNK